MNLQILWYGTLILDGRSGAASDTISTGIDPLHHRSHRLSFLHNKPGMVASRQQNSNPGRDLFQEFGTFRCGIFNRTALVGACQRLLVRKKPRQKPSFDQVSNRLRVLALLLLFGSRRMWSTSMWMLPRVLATVVQRHHRFAGTSPRHFSAVCFTLAAILYSRPVHTFADPILPRRRPREKNCPFYGCPLYPTDVHYSSDSVKNVLENLRELRSSQIDASLFTKETTQWNRPDAACLTLIGYKGGPLQSQINQDRAVVVSPYYLTNETNTADNAWEEERILLGVFDGHATRGEIVSEYTVQQIPQVLAKRLKDLPKEPVLRQNATVQALRDTFVELDRTVPADPSGGCTASVVMKQDEKVYVANAGDSRSFVVVYRPSTNVSKVVYISREDKPSLPDEKARVEAMGGQVYIPMRGTSRVVYQDPLTGAPTGLAMSRSIGDWEAGKRGVIADPIVDVLDLNHLVTAALAGSHEKEQCFMVDEQGEIDTAACTSAEMEAILAEEDDVYVFAVSASDGLMDFLEASEIAKILSPSLFHKDGSHPVTACELLIFAAANAWQDAKQGRYRDDIAIAVSVLRRPSESTQTPQ